MKCTNCNEFISEDSKFCQFCGHKVTITKNSEAEVNEFWSKFIKYSYETDEEKRAENNKLIPDNIKEICTRLSTNLFETLKNDHQDLQDLPFSTVENIKTFYFLSCVDGYWLFITNKEIKNEKIKNKSADVEVVISEWKKTLSDEEKFNRYFTDNFMKVFDANENLEFDLLLKNNPQIKELPTKTVDQIKSDLYKTTLWSYLCCEIADNL